MTDRIPEYGSHQNGWWGELSGDQSTDPDAAAARDALAAFAESKRYCSTDDPDATGVIAPEDVARYREMIRQQAIPGQTEFAERPRLGADYFNGGSDAGQEVAGQRSKQPRAERADNKKSSRSKEHRRRRFGRAKAALALGAIVSPYAYASAHQADLTPNIVEVVQSLPESKDKISTYQEEYGLLDPAAALALYGNLKLRIIGDDGESDE